MGAITGLLGLNGSPQNPVNQGQIQGSIAGSNNAIQGQQALLNALQGQNGIQNQSSVYNQLQGVANGTGPNPAQTMLNQATGQNVANQAALAAGQRGASSNVGLMARQAAQQGSQAQQQAAGQGATMQAQQSLGALGQLQNVAGQQVGQQIGATGALTGANQAQQGQLLNAQQGYNQALAGMQNAQTGNQAGLLGGLGNAVGGAAQTITGGLAQGGQVPQAAPVATGPQSTLGKFLSNGFAEGGSVGKVPVVLSPQEKVLSSKQAKDFAEGGALKASTVPGTPKNPGKNDYANDTYHTTAKPGSIVIPLEDLHSNEDARRFVQATLAKKRSK
jgi:hypothetical protein